MRNFDGPVAAVQDLTKLLIDGAVPAGKLRDRLAQSISEPSPVDAIVSATEAIFAKQQRDAKDVPDELADWGAAGALMAEGNGWHGFNVDSRGGRIAKVLRKQSLAKDKIPAVTPQYDVDAEPAPAATPAAEG